MAHIELRTSEPIGGQHSVDIGVEIMVEAQMKAALMKVKAARRYAEALVRAAIRRNGFTDAGHRLVMSDAERKDWERANPLAD